MTKFNVSRVTEDVVKWIQEFFHKNGFDCNAVIGISGGVDSSVVAALCVKALGKDRVIGVTIPNGVDKDLSVANSLIEFLGIKSYNIDINRVYYDILFGMNYNDIKISRQTKINLAPRLRMSVLYAISQSLNGRVANTCNLSEDWVGYSTRYGDSVGDFSPLSRLTKTEVFQMADYLGLPEELAHKVPTDGLCGKTDEENLGFMYATLDRYIRTGNIDDMDIKKKIDDMHAKNQFKLELMPCFEYVAEGVNNG